MNQLIGKKIRKLCYVFTTESNKFLVIFLANMLAKKKTGKLKNASFLFLHVSQRVREEC